MIERRIFQGWSWSQAEVWIWIAAGIKPDWRGRWTRLANQLVAWENTCRGCYVCRDNGPYSHGPCFNTPRDIEMQTKWRSA